MTRGNSADLITVAAVGDIAFVGERLGKPAPKLFSAVRPVFEECDLVIGNLESPLAKETRQANPEKCSLKSHPGWASELKANAISYLSLANNHIMDYGAEGLESTLKSLSSAGLHFSGAGGNIEEATRPAFIEIRGQKLAVLAYSLVEVSSRCYAGANLPGVAPFIQDQVLEHIRSMRGHVDFLILCLHWGIEHYKYPSPAQRKTAKQLSEAGVDLILGHHPHTVQGAEWINGRLIAYSLGNFVFDDFEWHYTLPDGTIGSRHVTLSEENRVGVVFKATLSRSGVFQEEPPLLIRTGEDGIELLSDVRHGLLLQERSRFFDRPGYDFFWKIHSLRMEWTLRFSRSFSFKYFWKNFKKLRPHHFVRLYTSITRSLRIVRGKSSNPYE